jgi:hypothetical protein
MILAMMKLMLGGAYKVLLKPAKREPNMGVTEVGTRQIEYKTKRVYSQNMKKGKLPPEQPNKKSAYKSKNK